MRNRRQAQDGFTLIELLVVILIIGILAAIAIPTFLKQREKGYRAGALSDMKNVATGLETWATDHGGTYVGLDGATKLTPALLDTGYRSTDWVAITVHADNASYCIEGTSVHLPGKTFVYRSDSGTVQIGLTGSTTC